MWTKLPGSKSAGRVQSVALKLITEREHEIELFVPEEFWTLKVLNLKIIRNNTNILAISLNLTIKKLKNFHLKIKMKLKIAV